MSSVATASGTPRYGSAAKWLHWSIAVLIVAQFGTAILMPDIGPHTVASTVINLHFSFGVLILALMAVRFINRLLHPVPLDMPGAPAWERMAAHMTQLAFYLILLVGPFLGWASASAHKLSVDVFGIITLPAIAAPRAHWALTAGDIHIYLMWTLAALIALHVAAALYHHFLRHDGVLRRMLPAGE